jgi:hypothetical protein
MSDQIHRWHGEVTVDLVCPGCPTEDQVTVSVSLPDDGSDFDELLEVARKEAGYDEMGHCEECADRHARQHAAEEAGEKARYDYKAMAEGSYKE